MATPSKGSAPKTRSKAAAAQAEESSELAPVARESDATGGATGNGDATPDGAAQEPFPTPPKTPDIGLSKLIKLRRIDFDKYARFLDSLFCAADEPPHGGTADKRLRFRFSLQRTDAYDGIKVATELFLIHQCAVLGDLSVVDGDPREVVDELARTVSGLDGEAVLPDGELNAFVEQYLKTLPAPNTDTRILPYLDVIRAKLGELTIRDCQRDQGWARYAGACLAGGVPCDRLTSPCLVELIWSYWQEQGMLVQAMNAIALRFQNRHSSRQRDPLANLTLDPLRPLSNLLWGFVQDERDRLTVVRRAHEYDHQYGLQISGRAVGALRSVDRRSRFLEIFHGLVRVASAFYKERDDRNKRADAFPVLNALRELHLVLGEGAHNQYGDLPMVSRVEMMVMQYLLARPEMREFFGNRTMVAHREPWMDRVDTMNKLQGWNATSVTHFNDLAVTGEQLLLSVRFGNWNQQDDANAAFHWADIWRHEIQRYVFAYRAVTGVDLLGEERVDPKAVKLLAAQPSVLIHNRAQSARQTG